MTSAIRAFVAIDLPDEIAGALARVQARLPVGRPVARENLHLTLAFLDDQPEEALENLHFELDRQRHPSFTLTLSGLGCFGGDNPRVIFANVLPNPALDGLHKLVLRSARRCGITVPGARFHPHVTLARLRPGAQAGPNLRAFLNKEAEFLLPDFQVTGFSLFQSELRPDGAVHHELARYALTRV